MAISLDEAQGRAGAISSRRRVIADAKARGLLPRSLDTAPTRWVRHAAAVLLLLVAAGLATADVKQVNHDGTTFGEEDWFFAALAAWFGVLAVLRSLRSVRYSAAGEAVTTRWLGVKRYLQHDQQFGEIAPAGVAIWDRCSRTVPRSAQRRRGRDPLEVEDPDTAWSRVGGDWHQVHVEYPTRFGYGERPLNVLVNGALRSVLFGVLAFVGLPVVVDLVWSAASNALDDRSNDANGRVHGAVRHDRGGDRRRVRRPARRWLATAFRGLADLRATATVTGQVVKHRHAESVVVVRGRSGERR